MNKVAEWIDSHFGKEPKLANKLFFEAFVAEIFTDVTIDREMLLQLADPISAAHTHQSEESDRQYTFFELLGPEYSKIIRPAYDRVVKNFTGGKNPKPYVDFNHPKSRATIKELYNIYNRAANNMIEYKLRS